MFCLNRQLHGHDLIRIAYLPPTSALVLVSYLVTFRSVGINVNRIGGPKGVSNINSAYFIHVMPKIGGRGGGGGWRL